jgi:uncharacterized protein (DUF1800 family)
MVLHWLDHFSIAIDKVGDPAIMSAYEDVLRANALGNFRTLASDVSRTAAMLYWLDNNGNDGSDPVHNPPNENFARELMQLYTIGPYKLAMDGEILTNAAGIPIPSFTENDVRQVARGLTGFYVDYTFAPYDNPNTRFRTMFASSMHTTGPETILGQFVNTPNTPTCADSIINALVTSSSSAPFLAKELLQRVAVENPSTRYVAEIAGVWRANVDNPNQIGLVLQAIENDPEFYTTAYRSMAKEPVELFEQLARDAPFVLQRAYSPQEGSVGPGSSIQRYLGYALQDPYNPPSVFSFYTPGDKRQLISQATLLTRVDDLGFMVANLSSNPASDTGLDLSALKAKIGSNMPKVVESYLLDDLVDANSASLASSLTTYFGTGLVDDEHLQGAIWIIVTSPEFEVN